MGRPWPRLSSDASAIYLAVAEALRTAVPTAIVQLGAGIFDAIDGIARAAIQGATLVAGAVFDGDFGNLLGAFVDGTVVFLQSFGPATQAVIDGIYLAQQTLTAVLEAEPVILQNLSEISTDPGVSNMRRAATATSTFMLDTTSVDFVDNGAGSGSPVTTDPVGSPGPEIGGGEPDDEDEAPTDEPDPDADEDADADADEEGPAGDTETGQVEPAGDTDDDTPVNGPSASPATGPAAQSASPDTDHEPENERESGERAED